MRFRDYCVAHMDQEQFHTAGEALEGAARQGVLVSWHEGYMTPVDPGYYCFDRPTESKWWLRRRETHYFWERIQ